MNKEEIREKWVVTFAYSGSCRREFFEQEFEIKKGEDINNTIKKYELEQNNGEAKSDRIRYWSKEKTTAENSHNQSQNKTIP